MRVAMVSLLLMGAVIGCTTVDNSGGVNDATKPKVNVLITRPGMSDAEVQEQPGAMPKVRRDLGNPLPAVKLDFSVLATATDMESGIKLVRLMMTRDLCYQTSGGNIANAHFATVERKRAEYTDRAHAPTQASVGDTGIFNNGTSGNDPNKYSDGNLLIRRGNANQPLLDAVGISTKWSMEATNFAGQITYSDVIYITAGDISCGINP